MDAKSSPSVKGYAGFNNSILLVKSHKSMLEIKDLCARFCSRSTRRVSRQDTVAVGVNARASGVS